MVFITAEIGPTWMGDYHRLYYTIKACKEAGFDAVKLQAFKKEHLNSRYWRIHGSVTEDNVDEVDSVAKLVGVKWYCMPCYPEAVDWLAPYVDMWKIRYRDQSNMELIKKVIEKDQTTLISTDTPEKWVREKKIHTLYCISKYPTLKDEVDFERMKDFDGYSCHTPDILHTSMAVAESKAKFLEVHVTPDHNDPLIVDNNVSFSLNSLKDLVERVRIWEQE